MNYIPAHLVGRNLSILNNPKQTLEQKDIPVGGLPGVLPVDEKNVYFDVSAIIIAFVLLGKYMKEIIKKRSSAAVRKLLDLKPQTARVFEKVKKWI